MGKKRKNIEIITENISDTRQELPAAATIVTAGDFKFICPHCGQHLSCPPEAEGVECQCPNCTKQIIPERQ